MSQQTDTKKAGRAVLGVTVVGDQLHAVLVRKGSGGKALVVGRFLRQRVKHASFASAQSLATALPGLNTDDSDYTLQVGDGTADSQPSIEADFGAPGGKPGSAKKTGDLAAAATARAQSMAPQLREVLHECVQLGYPSPSVVFCLVPPDVQYLEVDRAEDDDSKPLDTKTLTEIALKEIDGASADRLAFAHMAPQGDRPRAVIVSAAQANSALATLEALSDQAGDLIADRVVDAEATVMVNLVERAKLAAEKERAMIVRVGMEDTAVFFFEGGRLVHTERLRSVTAYDPPDTVCSRILLVQDERRIADIGTIVVTSSGRAEPLVDAFGRHYPASAVETMQSVLEETGIKLDADADHLKAPAAAALCAAVKWLDPDAAEPQTNLLPKRLQRKRRQLSVAWHSVVALLLLFGIVVFGGMRYQDRAAEIERLEREMVTNPIPQPLQDPVYLQARVDSLEGVRATYTRALNVLDSLLLGSDRWVTTMERVSRATSQTPRTWIDGISPKTGTSVTVNGHSLTRLAIVDMSRRLNGAIQQLTYQDIGQQRVYSFELLVPTPIELPRAAVYLRTQTPDQEPVGDAEIHPAFHDH